MLTFTIEHKFCGFTTKIQGENVMDALRRAGKDLRYWTVKKIEA